MTEHLVVFNVVGLSPKYLNLLRELPNFSDLMSNGLAVPVDPVFPALTLPAQASLVTGSWPEQHGIVANGFYDRNRMEVSFWDQHRFLVQGRPLWERIKRRRPDMTTAVLFWQNTLHGQADIIVTPKPMHAEHELIQWCYSKPVGYYESLVEEIGPFNLFDYWGPFASPNASRWIIDSAVATMRRHRPHLMMVYLPHLDYSCQKYGPDDSRVVEDLKIADTLIGNFRDALGDMGLDDRTTLAVVSEYALSPVSDAVSPNRILRDAGLLAVREIQGREYLDIEFSRAFAMVDHQIAHVYVHDENDCDAVASLLQGTPGIQALWDGERKHRAHVNHRRSGELIVLADPDRWLAYYWWLDSGKAPDFADHVDIHRKPGYDPLELFIDEKTFKIFSDTTLIKGSHGLPARDRDQMAMLMIGGDAGERMELTEPVPMVDVSAILEQVLIS
ncbi:alkaline phosphatase family protein [Desulfosarcina ovata]|uniref:Alkaline phosphatase family protein n=1 Tax=Desulfosarcina ovata subsp. ovata TaxID=2752305 RepID=A0A5K8A4Y3_9BACT|nr:nucleotide pyrophosphatase/phosphodiesterase family protein [Desulfosarcina ovata]BBO87579.1 alkaline phosphatase family protein [Desulfosarcina ovata subsp. ovata]